METIENKGWQQPNEHPSAWQKITNNTLVKALVIGFLILIMLIPLSMIRGLISERQVMSESAAREIGEKWGGAQEVYGPILTIPYTYLKKVDKETVESVGYAHFLPEDLKVNGALKPEVRYRGIYNTTVYQSEISLKGTFKFPNIAHISDMQKIKWDEAFVGVNISDMKGIKSDIAVLWNGEKPEVIPGAVSRDIMSGGFAIKTPLTPQSSKDAVISFEVKLMLNGSSSIYFMPIGKRNEVELSSSWSSPSFAGNFLPDARTISDSGFIAKWSILGYNRDYPQQWLNGEYYYKMCDSRFGVNLQTSAGHYRETERSVKYAVMFIALTFLVFFLVEVLSRKRIHPIQYVLVSIGILLFYTLLLSISEQLSFGIAYAISAVAITALITGYSRSVFGSTKLMAVMGIFMSTLYTFLYVLLQLEEIALLVGSIGIFMALALVMYISRRVNWFDLSGTMAKK